MTRRLFLERVTPVAVTLGMLIASPVHAFQEVEGQTQDRPIVRRRAPEGQRRGALAFARTELFFGTAKPGGAVTEEEFRTFLDEFVTPLFPDGLTVVKADGQFRGADGVTIKEESFVLILLYPVEGHKTSSRNIDAIRRTYMTRHRQESVLRVDDRSWCGCRSESRTQEVNATGKIKFRVPVLRDPSRSPTTMW